MALLKQLVYPNGTAQQFSDYAFLLEKIPTVERRTAMTQVLSRQSAVLARLSVTPDTDIDKIAAYWGNMPNVRFTDIRPLMESLKQLPEGGTISLLYLLPKFARDRLYTFPLPAQPGDPMMDCHWTTFNFSNDTPDNRFNDPTYAVEYIRKNYYQIAAPSLYGDILLLMNDKNEVKHSAVFHGRQHRLHQKRKQLSPAVDADADSRFAGDLSGHARDEADLYAAENGLKRPTGHSASPPCGVCPFQVFSRNPF